MDTRAVPAITAPPLNEPNTDTVALPPVPDDPPDAGGVQPVFALPAVPLLPVPDRTTPPATPVREPALKKGRTVSPTTAAGLVADAAHCYHLVAMDGWDGSAAPPEMFHLPKVFSAIDVVKHAPTEITDAMATAAGEFTAEILATGAEELRTQSRKEVKALEKEIPWRKIYGEKETDPQQYKDFVESAKKEHTTWRKWASARPLSKKQVEEILRCPRKSKRILRARGLYRDKSGGRGKRQAKTRVVVMGCNHPDLADIERNSPTATRASFFVLIQIFCTGSLTGEWIFACADAEAAFLQGQAPDEDETYMWRPNDPILNAAGAFQDSELWELVGNAYGRADAPWIWTKKVIETFVALGFVCHSLDMVFFLYHVKGKIVAAALMHVDDLLITWDRTLFDISPVKSSLNWRNWQESPAQLEWNGREISFVPEQNGTSVRISVTRYLKSRKPVYISRDKIANADDPLDAADRTEMKGIVGDLQYAASTCRMDLAGGTSLVQKGEMTVSELHQANELLKYAVATADCGVRIRPVPLDDMVVVGFGDSSFANADELKTQIAHVIVVTNRACLTGEAGGSIMSWSSNRTKRIVRSTLAGESLAADNAADNALYIASFLSEVFSQKRATDGHIEIPIFVATDCRSLYDAFQKAQPKVSEKRTLIDLLSLKESIAKDGLRWIPTHLQLSDCMTKLDARLMILMLEIMADTQCQLRNQAG